MAAENCHAKFNWGAACSVLGEWEVAASQEDPSITRSLYIRERNCTVKHHIQYLTKLKVSQSTANLEKNLPKMAVHLKKSYTSLCHSQ